MYLNFRISTNIVDCKTTLFGRYGTLYKTNHMWLNDDSHLNSGGLENAWFFVLKNAIISKPEVAKTATKRCFTKNIKSVLEVV